MKRILLLIFLIFTYTFGYTQIDKDADLAKKLKVKYEEKDYEEEVVVLSSKINFTFDFSKSKIALAPVSALETIKEDLIALKGNYDYKNALYYNNESAVNYVKGFGKNRRPMEVYSIDKAYEMSGIFYTDMRMKIFSMNFSESGEKKSYEAVKQYFDVKYLTSVYFHDSNPIEEKTISFQVPSWLTVELKEMNFAGYDIKKTILEDAKKKITTHTFVVKNLSRIKKEDNAPGMSYTYPHIMVLCKSYINKDVSVQLFNSTDNLYAWYKELANKIGNKRDVIKPTVLKLIESKKTDREKVEAIYYWIQDNIKYIAFEDGIAGFKPESAQNVFNNKYGDCKGMGNLAKEMLCIAGFDARLTWIGTKHIAYDYSIPSIAVDNHMICTLFLKGEKYFIDPTETYIALGDNADRIQGRPVLIEDGEKYILSKVPAFTKERNKIEVKKELVIDGELMVGKAQYVYNGEAKTHILRGFNNLRTEKKEDVLKNFIHKGNKNMTISNLVNSDLTNRDLPVKFDYNFEIKNQISSFGNEIYFTMDFENGFGDLDIDSLRIADYEFDYKILNTTSIELAIPPGYQLKHMPVNVNKTYPGFTVNVNFLQTGNKIVYKKEIAIPDGIVRKKDFRIWNATIKELKNAYDDQIILVKK